MIIVCDCLYFSQFHKELLITIDSYLDQSGVVLFVNPSRGDSMTDFLSLATKSYEYSMVQFEEEGYVKELNRIGMGEGFNVEKDVPYFI